MTAAGEAYFGKAQDDTSWINSSVGVKCWLAGGLGASWH